MWAGIIVALKLLYGFWQFFVERNAAKKLLKKEALDEVIKGIKKRDASTITGGFDRLNRL